MSGQGYAGPGAGFPWRPLRIPRIAWGPPRRFLGPSHSQFTHIELTQENAPGLFDPGYHRGILGGDEILVHLGSVGGQDAGGLVLVLHRHRHTG